ncbi:Voltage-dependent calcium channel subunit alpha-2/delta-1 [Tupaia chinensis]|uniref:Voltage-dependent calcium channel subunit alpha-2/delta-1 n=1 Tax=Tupaia chinensis TaxID=246437 RepID=L9K1C1_TUPCH|nr:Voltage-dependent calcium channel subunit alpha-2/delta-1 [Tupaia chinensis]
MAAGCLLALTLTLFQSLLIGPSSEEPFPSPVTVQTRLDPKLLGALDSLLDPKRACSWQQNELSTLGACRYWSHAIRPPKPFLGNI